MDLESKLVEIAARLNIGIMAALSIIELTDKVPSAAWAYNHKTKKEVILFNPSFLEMLPVDEAAMVIRHELMHRLFYAKLFMRSIPSNMATNVVLDAFVNTILYQSIDHTALVNLCNRIHQLEPHNDPSDLITCNFKDKWDEIQDPDIRDMYQSIWDSSVQPRIFDIYQKVNTWIYKNAPEEDSQENSQGNSEGDSENSESGKDSKNDSNSKGKSRSKEKKEEKKNDAKGQEQDQGTDKDEDETGEGGSEEQGKEEEDQDAAGDSENGYQVHEIPEGVDPSGSLNSIAERSFSDQMSELNDIADTIDPVYVDIEDTYNYMQEIVLKQELDRVVTDILYTYVPEQTIDLMPIELSTTGEIMVLNGVSELTGLFWNRANRKYHANLTVYLDVSPSMDKWVPRVIYMVESLRDKLPTNVCVFSGQVAEVATEEFIKGTFPRGYSTSFEAVMRHFLNQNESEVAMIVTDGYSSIWTETAAAFRKSGKELIVILCDSLGNNRDNGGMLKELAEYCHTIWSDPDTKKRVLEYYS